MKRIAWVVSGLAALAIGGSAYFLTQTPYTKTSLCSEADDTEVRQELRSEDAFSLNIQRSETKEGEEFYWFQFGERIDGTSTLGVGLKTYPTIDALLDDFKQNGYPHGDKTTLIFNFKDKFYTKEGWQDISRAQMDQAARYFNVKRVIYCDYSC